MELLNKLILALTLGALLNANNSTGLEPVAGTRIDCYPIEGATKEKCEALGCTWSPVNESSKSNRDDWSPIKQLDDWKQTKARVDQPWCYFARDYVGYEVVKGYPRSTIQGSAILKLRRVRPSLFVDDVQELAVDIEPHGNGDILRVRIYDANSKRFEPELPELNLKGKKHQSVSSVGDQATALKLFKIVLVKNPINGEARKLVIKRESNDAILFSADLSKLIYSDKFIQLTSDLDSPFVYGLGEHYDTFTKWVNQYKVYSFYNTDQLTLPGGQRSYGGFPFYINLDSENQTQAHGVYLRNSNAMDIILHPIKSVTFRPIGGVLDFFIFLGPSSNDVVSQYQNLVGLPELPPRWSLGFHLCRYNYGSLNKTRLVWDRTREAGIPFDVQWNDIDYMDHYNDFTYDHNKYNGLPEFVDELHHVGMHYVILFDPGVSQEANYYPYELGQQMDIFVKNATNQTLVGKVWNSSGRTVFPDFSNPMSHDYWSKLFAKFHEELAFDGAWIDMNDISNFVDGSIDGCPWSSETIESTPYKPGGLSLQHHSLCLSAKHRAGLEYNLHNLYSFYEAIATQKALRVARPGRRTLIISRSTSPGQGHFSGHWSGDVRSNWEYLRWSIPSMLEHSIYGFSLIGSDICGFVGNTTPELCARWSTLGAFYTFSRNHNDDTSIDQDPVALGAQVVEANKNAQTKRYSLLPYLYSLMHQASRFGEPIVRSIPLEFHGKDPEALRVEDQFMWGEALMISPIVYQDTYTKTTFLPKGRWYETDILTTTTTEPRDDFKVPKLIDSMGGPGGWFKSDNISLTNLPIFYRGGRIVPIYPKVGKTISETVQQPIGLEVSLCRMGRAHGLLYLDDGETLDIKDYQLFTMNATYSSLQIELTSANGKPNQTQFGLVKIYGFNKRVNKVLISSPPNATEELEYKQNNHTLVFDMNSIVAQSGVPIIVNLQ